MNILRNVAKEICVICGEPHHVNNCNFIKIVKHVPDSKIPSRAKLSLPNFLQLQILTDGSYSIVTKSQIEKGTKFGPFQADVTDTLDPGNNFPLKIFKSDEKENIEYYLDVQDENKCSWLMFVTAAESSDEQNLICYQENSQIFYLSIKDILPGESLKVWYASYYGSKMNKNILEERDMNSSKKSIDVNGLVKTQQKIVDRKTWTCKFCSQTDNTIVAFAKHMLRHYMNQLKKNCEICKKTFGTKKGLSKHLKIVHNLSYQTAENKNKQILLNNKLPSSEINLGGPMLNDIFTDSSDLQQNEFDINQSLLLDSDNLNVETFLNENVKDLDHFNFDIDDNQKQFVCDICLKQFGKLKLLIIHMRHHTGEFMCLKCLKIFCRRENLKTHTCNLKSQLICNLCQKAFAQKKYLNRHIQAQHLNKFRCRSCNKRYYSNKEMLEHNCSKQSDESKDTFTCSLCLKQFLRLIYLKRHMKTHLPKGQNVKKESVICERCGALLQNKHSYHLHLQKHKDPDFVCQVCDKKFYRQDSLTAHMMTHKEQFDFECQLCAKKLKSEKILKKHVQLHMKTTKFKCKNCPQTFTLKSSLVRHMKSVHDEPKNNIIEEYYSCTLCDKKMKLKSSLLRHLRKMHDKQKVDLNQIKPIHVEVAVVEKNDDKFETDNITIKTEVIKKQIKLLPANSGNAKEVCLSIPDLSEVDQEITLDKNAYILENGTIVQPQANSDNVIMYVLDHSFTN